MLGGLRKAVLVAVAACLSGTGAPVFAQAQSENSSGFYGGISLRDGGIESASTVRGSTQTPWVKFAPAASDETDTGALLFGGYRWSNDLAVEAAVNAREGFALGHDSKSLGLALGDVATRAWNVDVFTSWAMRPAVSLYGRLGYGQSESRFLSPVPSLSSDTAYGVREGVNYGVGLRFDVTRSVGLRMEYSRFGRQSLTNLSDLLSEGLTENDQLSVGVQLRF